MPTSQKTTILSKLLLFSSLVLGIFLFFYKINSIPNGIYADEATVGYNAFSILQTGKDEYGKSLPVAFRFFGAYTPPLYVYLAVPLVKIFGLNEFSVRFLSAFSSLLCIVLVYLFCKSLKFYKSSFTPSLSALLFATAPWVVFNARLGYEVTLGYIAYYLGVFLIWGSLKEEKINWLGLFVLSLSTYLAHTERYLVPLFVVTVAVVWRKIIFRKSNFSKSFLPISILFFSQLPNLYLLTTPAFWVKNVSFGNSSLGQSVWDFVSQLVLYLSPKTYFGQPLLDINLQHFIPNMSLFYSWQIIPFLIGLLILVKTYRTDSSKMLSILLITSSIPASFSGHFISIQRVLTMIIPILLTTSLGLDFLLVRHKRMAVTLLVIFMVGSLVLLWRSYFVLFPGLRSGWWNYGAKEVSIIVKQNSEIPVVLDNSRDQALYSVLAFHLRFSPEVFHSQFPKNITSKYYTNPPFNPDLNLGNLSLHPIDWSSDSLKKQILIGDNLAISQDQAKEHFLTLVLTIKDPTGKILFQAYETNPSLKAADNERKARINSKLSL